MTLLWLPLFLLGLVVVPLLAYAGAYEYRDVARYDRRLLTWHHRLAWLFGNDEDGVDGLRGTLPADFLPRPGWAGEWEQAWWFERTARNSVALRIVKWSAFRNPVNNFRFSRLVDFRFEPHRLRWFANVEDCSLALQELRAASSSARPLFYLFAWHGWRSQLWLVWPLSSSRHLRLRVGAKAVMPRMRNGIPAEDYLHASESWTPLQFSPWRKG